MVLKQANVYHFVLHAMTRHILLQGVQNILGLAFSGSLSENGVMRMSHYKYRILSKILYQSCHHNIYFSSFKV